MASLQSETFSGLVGGMNLAKPAHEIDDVEAQYIQDALLDYPGLIRRRGPLKLAEGIFTDFTEKASGITGTLDPVGNYKIAILTGSPTTGFARLLAGDYLTYESFTWPNELPGTPPSNPYRIFDSKPAIGGGVFIGTSSTPTGKAGRESNLALWRGAHKASYSTGTVTFVRGSKTVTGSGTSWTANACPGMFLFASVEVAQQTGGAVKVLLGVVKSVDSNTQITLEANAPYGSAAGQVYDLHPLRGHSFKVAKGRITTTTASTTVTGANTKFISQYMDEALSIQNGTLTSGSPVVTGIASTTGMLRGMRITGTGVPANTLISSVDSGTQITMTQNASASGAQSLTFKDGWNLYRASDMTWIGRVGLINNEISITLAANAAIALSNERFVALRSRHLNYGTGVGIDTSAAPSIGSTNWRPGFLNANYAGRQWYANHGTTLEETSRVYYSEVGDPEAMDFSAFDGDFINAFSTIETDTPVMALVPAYNSLVVLKENEAFAVAGSSPTTFTLKKLYDDGTLAGQSAVSYGGGVVWAGREGITFFDGIQTTNLSKDKLGDYYKNATADFDPALYRMWAMVVREHYFLFIEKFDPDVVPIKGSTPVVPESTTICVNMNNGSVSLMTNLNIRGYIETPADIGRRAVYLINRIKDNYIGNPDFETDTSGWLANGSATIARDTTEFKYGLASMKITPTADDSTSRANISLSAEILTLGTIYTTSVWLKGGGSATGKSLQILLWETGGAAGAQPVAQSFPTLLEGWNKYTITGALNQADRTNIELYVGGTASSGWKLATGDCLFVDGVRVEVGSTAKPFFVGDNFTGGAIADAAALFDEEGIDDLACDAGLQGPDFYLESKKFTFGDAMRKKLFKQIFMTYLSNGDSLHLDTVLGLQRLGRTAKSVFPATNYVWDNLPLLASDWDALGGEFATWDLLNDSNFKPKRIKFLKRSQAMSFRLWQNSMDITRLQMGPFSLAYKWQRIGRI